MLELNTINQVIATKANIWSERIALQMLTSGNLCTYSYATLMQECKAGAKQIKEANVKPGDRIVLLSENRPEWAITYLAALEAQTTVVLIDSTFPAKDLSQLIEKSDPRLLIVSPRLWEKLPSLVTLGLPVLNLEDKFTHYEGTPKQVPPNIPLTEDPDLEIASILFTSGTGGFPKGVLVTHQSLLHCARCGLDLINIKSTNKPHRFLCILPLHHIAALTGLLIAPLLDGAIITFIEPIDKENIFAALTQTKATILPAVPRFYDLIYKGIINQIEQKGKLTQGIISGLGSFSDWVRSVTSLNIASVLFRSIHQAFGGELKYCFSGASPLATEVKLGMEKLGFTILEGYGLTEAGVCVYNTLNQSRIGHVGKPYKGIEIRIDRPNPQTGEGEICIRGISLMKGYFRDAKATAEVLRDGWLYTGDLGRLDAQGNLIITGRIKELIVTAGGKKVAPSVVEEYYRGITGVKELAVFGMPAREGLGESIHAAVVLDSVANQEVNHQDILQKIWQEIEIISVQVPTYLRIQKIHIIEELPKTTTLKVKRKELQKLIAYQLKSEQREISYDQVELLTQKAILDREILLTLPQIQQIEKLKAYLLEVVASVLQTNLSASDINESLLALGIDSLNATELINRLRSELGWEVSPEQLLNGSSIQELANSWDNQNPSLSSNDLTINPISRQENLPLSYDQERLWLLNQIAPHNSIYNLSIAVQLSGRLEINILQQALEAIAQRHEILRTNFQMANGYPVQVIALHPTIPLPIIDLQHLSTDEVSAEVKQLATLESQKPFDLSNGLLWRVRLVKLSPDSHVLLLTMHHIISDVWSISIFLQELSTIYQAFLQGETKPLPKLPIQYADFADWQRKHLSGVLAERDLDYWKKQLEGISGKFVLPTDYPRPLKPTFQSSYYTFKISANVWSAVKQLSKQYNVTPFITLLTGFNILLHQSSGETDIIVGSPILGRTNQQLQSLIGFFAYPVILRNNLSGNPSFLELLERVRQVVLSAYTHQNLPLEQVVKAVQLKQQPKPHNLFQILFSFVGKQPAKFSTCALTISPIWEMFYAPTDLDLLYTLLEVDEELVGLVTYNNELFTESRIANFINSYCQILEQVINSPNQLQLKTELPNQNIVNQNLETVSPKLAIAANFTADPVIDTLEFWLNQLDLNWKIELAPYNQIFQQILAPDSLFAANKSGINVILLRLEDWIQNQNQTNTFSEFSAALKSLTQRTDASYIICFCPASVGNITDSNSSLLVQKIEELITAELAEVSGIYLLTTKEILTKYPVQEIDDRQGNKLAHIPYTPLFFTALGTAIARKIHTILQNPYKVIVLDCDRTLWQGVCGEDSINEIIISEPYQKLQALMIAQQQQGMLLCLCSKNNESDVFQVFEKHQDMLLQKKHLVSWRINWQSKSENLKSLAQELQLSLDSFIFIDDNPVECAEVRANLPQVLTLQLPIQSETIPQFLQHIWSFDQLKVTAEDRQRTLYYQQNIQRQQVFQQSLTLAEFIQNLDLQVKISQMLPHQALRVAQLTQRTNQFNNITLRHSESEIQNLSQSGRYKFLIVEVQDRFGDYGLVGVIFFTEKENNLEVDTLLLSCRVLGKGVEHQMLAHLGKIAQQQGLLKVIIPYKPTSKNQPVLDFLTSLEPNYQLPWQDGYRFEFTANFCAAIAYAPKSAKPSELPTQQPTTKSVIKANSELINYIATNLDDAEIIHQAIESKKPHQVEIKNQATLTKIDLVEQVTVMMAEILGLSEIMPTTNFFADGGNSLDAVRLLSKINHQLNLNFSLDDLFIHPTPESLSALANGTSTRKTLEEDLAVLLAQDIELDAKQVPFQTQLWQPKSQIKRILLTGATGNLGVFLLMDLLRFTDATVYCLIRADNPEAAVQRLQAAFKRCELLWSNEVKRRISIVLGDLSKPYLGLNGTTWMQYGEQFDAIYHCAADVHFTRPYQSLRQVTVEGTRTILALACQTRLKPVYYVSTIGVFHSEECLQKASLQESDPLGNGILLPTGYQQAKWVAEGLVTRARERGVPIVIFRPGIIGPHSRTGVFSAKDLSVIFLKTVFKHNLMPHSRALDMAPVDWVSKALVTISLQPESIGQTFHLVHPQPITVEDLRQGSVLAGFNLRSQSLDQWLEEVSIAAKIDPDHPMASLIPILEVKGAKNLMRILNLAPTVSLENTLKALKGTYITCPPMDSKQVKIWFERFRQDGVVTSLAKEHRYLWFKERFRGFCTLKSSLAEAEDIFQAGYEQGMILESPLNMDITAFISSIAQVLGDRKVQVEGSVSCPTIHPEPLKIHTGYWQILTDTAINQQTESESRWLRYYLELEDIQGNHFWLEGEKIIRLGLDIWRQTRTLNVLIRDASGLSWVGQTIIPAESYMNDQVRGLRMDETIPKSDRQKAKLLWLFLLWGSGGRTYLQILLRFASNNFYEYINKR